jgi:hypothetical protein
MQILHSLLTRRSLLARTGIAAAAVALAAVFPRLAFAQSADELKRRGLAGETLQGYMVARDSSVAGRVEQINQERRQLYQQRAAQEGISMEAVAAVYAKQIIENSPPGTWYQSQSGQWVQK